VSETVIGRVPEAWRISSLGAVCALGGGNIQTGPFGSQLHASDYVLVGIPSIMPQNIGEDRIVTDRIARIRLSDAERLGRYLVLSGDIVYSRRGDVERRALVRDEEDGWLCGTGCLRIRFGKEYVDPLYAFYYLGHPEVRAWIVRHAIGATMPNLNTSILAALPFVRPSLGEQRTIASVLGALDDKIELNRRANETLEAIARAIFKSWFVDFDPVRAKVDGRQPIGMDAETAALFPNSFSACQIGSAPTGWDIISVYDCATYVNGAAFTASQFSADKSGLPIVKIAELKNGITAGTAFTLEKQGDEIRIGFGDVLFSWSGSPETSIGTFIWCGRAGWLNQHIFKIVPPDCESKAFVLGLLKQLTPEFIEIARNKQTTGLGHVTVADLKRIKIAVPALGARKAFHNLAGPIWERWMLNTAESQTLSLIRDALLPKLLSGQLLLRDAEKVVEAHV
jgi:type I restriction enzyme, S subunit